MRRQAGHLPTKEEDSPFVRFGLSADQTEQRRLSGAVRADDGSALACCDGKIHSVHSVKPLKRLRDTGEAQRKVGRVSHNAHVPPILAFPRKGGRYYKVARNPEGLVPSS